MADWRDLTEEDGFDRLARTYDIIAGVCSMLPLPINLISGEGAKVGDVIDGIADVCRIVKETPIPGHVEAAIFSSCTYWLAAMEIFAAFRARPIDYRANAFAMLILDSELSIEPAIAWLAEDGR
ncbi:hypothetical protein [Streptomyces mobaraensis]|uniref:Uncharacterized protein n=1 Tax=Streptomyces mobaraensis TaxID=35621 RepID=A0A5N5WD96_STRMB|nr:hypothetical protein [Streptomyces mobaraensis]KAB7850144.1 hypothetical protein FRZ00_05965 [Streptomyces mobaraensis]